MRDRLRAVRIVSTPETLDATTFDGVAMRTAPDEVLLVDPVSIPALDDPHAIVMDDAGWHGARFTTDDAAWLLERGCEWEAPTERPAFAQGMVLGIAVKLWFDDDGMLLVVPSAMSFEFNDRYETIRRRESA